MKQVATSAIDALKGSPGLLVLVMLQAGVLAAIYFGVERARDQQQEREMMLITRCFDAR